MFDNLLRGRLFDAGIRPSQMLPEDRASFADRVKGHFPDMPVIGALTEVALNPWVWLAAVTSVPFKMPQINQVWNPATRYLPMVRKMGPFLENIGFLTAQQELWGSDMIRSLRKVEEGMDNFISLSNDVMVARNDALRRLGLKQFADDPVLNAAMQAKLHGLDRVRTEVRFKFSGKMRTPELVEKELEAILDGKKLDRYLREKGVDDVVRQTQQAYERMWETLFTTGGKIDSDKVIRVQRGMTVDLDGRKIGTTRGTPMEKLFGHDVMEALAEGALGEDTFRSWVEMSMQRKNFYAPINHNRVYQKSVSGTGAYKRLSDTEVNQVYGTFRERPPIVKRFGSSLERTKISNLYDPGDLGLLEQFGNRNFAGALDDSLHYRDEVAASTAPDDLFGLPSLNYERGLEKYVRTGSRTYGLHVLEPDDFVLQGQREARERIRQAVKEGRIKAPEATYDRPFSGPGRSVMADATRGMDEPKGGFSMYDVVRASYQTVTDPRTKEHLRMGYLPVVLGEKSLRNGLFTTAYVNSKHFLRGVLETDAVKSSMGRGATKDLYGKLKQWAAVTPDDPMLIDREVASFFYSSTLGANIASVAINLTQPLITLPRIMESQHVLAGYKGAFADLGAYLKNRGEHFGKYGFTRRGLLLGPEHRGEKADLIRRSFRFADDAEIGPSVHETIDRIGGPLLRHARVGPLGKLNDVEEFTLKLFEKGEFFNRSVAAHATVSAAKAQGLKDPKAISEAVRMVSEQTQFGAGPLNTPYVFLSPHTQVGFLANPAFRQFLTFTTRMTTGLVEGAKIGGGGLRETLDTRSAGKALLTLRDSMRALAVSAILYETGKEMLGIDLTPGTIIGATGGLYRESGALAPLPAPPAVTLPLSIGEYLLTGEKEALKYTLPTLIPGGVPLAKALGALPALPGGNALGLQRTFVDYSQRTQDGRYPVFTPEGRIISYETLPAILAKGAGLDMGAFRDEGEMIAYLTRIREDSIEFRRRYLQAAAKNNMKEMEQIRKEYKRKYGMELQVNEQQIQGFQRTMEASRLERTLENLPRELRSRMVPAVAQEFAGRLGMTPEQFQEGLTISQRNDARARNLPMDRGTEARVRESLERMNQQVQAATQRRSDAFERYDPFTPFGRQ